MSLRCRIGLHRWPSEPFHKELIRSTGEHFLFSSVGLQTGKRRCQGCGAEQVVGRRGVMSAAILPSSATPWKRISRRRAKKIAELPIL